MGIHKHTHRTSLGFPENDLAKGYLVGINHILINILLVDSTIKSTSDKLRGSFEYFKRTFEHLSFFFLET